MYGKKRWKRVLGKVESIRSFHGTDRKSNLTLNFETGVCSYRRNTNLFQIIINPETVEEEINTPVAPNAPPAPNAPAAPNAPPAPKAPPAPNAPPLLDGKAPPASKKAPAKPPRVEKVGKLSKIHWSKLTKDPNVQCMINQRFKRFPKGVIEVYETFWTTLPQIDIKRHESFLSTRFAEKTLSNLPTITTARQENNYTSPKNKVAITILNAKDQTAIGIMRKKMDNTTPQKIEEWMSKLSLKKFVNKMGNLLELLVEMVKIAESDKDGRNYMPQLLDKELDKSKLSSQEDVYLYELHQIRNFTTYMQIVRMYQELVIEKEEKYLTYLKNVVTACAEIRNSGAFKDLISCIVQVGKFLNSHTDFPGFDMSQAPLEYITNFKDKTEESTSIGLHSLNIIEKANPGKNYKKLLKSEMKTVFDLGRPNALKASYVQNDLIKWDGQIKKIQKESNSNSAIDVIAKKLSNIQTISDKVANVFFETMIYMGLNPVNYEKGKEKPKLPSSALFSPISYFIEHILKEKENQEKELKRKAVVKRNPKTKVKILKTKIDKKENNTSFKSRKKGSWLKTKRTEKPGVLDEIVAFNKYNLRHRDKGEEAGDVETDGGPSESTERGRSKRSVRRVKWIKKTTQFTYFRGTEWVKITWQFSYFRKATWIKRTWKFTFLREAKQKYPQVRL